MKHKVRIIIPYFGKFLDSIKPFLRSCEQNSDFQWLFFTDDNLPFVPNNVSVIQCELEDIKKRVEKKLGFKVALNAPYKLCDFRPAFGLIFEEELKDADFWGWGDVDLIYGDLSHFITDEVLDTYDKVYPCGHLSLVRNAEEINRVFMLDVPGTLSYKDVFNSGKNFIFDEYKGLNEKLRYIGKKVYGRIDFADMDIVYQRFRTADKKTINWVFPDFLYKKYIPKNYKRQTFVYEKGKTYRFYINKRNVHQDELVYIHYRHKIPCQLRIEEIDEYYITNRGFVKKNKPVTLEEIERTNKYLGRAKEVKEYIAFCKERIIYFLGANKKLRNAIRQLKGKEKIL